MKNMVGKEAKLYNYISNVFMTISDYYNYEYMEMPLEDNLSLEDRAKDYYLEKVKKGIKKYCYKGNANTDNKEEKEFGFIAIDIDTINQDAEIISMTYRILEELKLENIIVKLSANSTYDLKKLQEYLEHLDVDYEIDDNIKDNEMLSFLVVEQVGDKEIVLARGSKKEDKINTIASVCYLDNILEIIKVIYEDHDFSTLTQVYILSETEEERIVGMRLAQDLRWCEIKVDIDNTNKTRAEQQDSIQNVNFIIDINKEDLNKGLIKVIDFLTKEETLVDENEIIDYIVSNI